MENTTAIYESALTLALPRVVVLALAWSLYSDQRALHDDFETVSAIGISRLILISGITYDDVKWDKATTDKALDPCLSGRPLLGIISHQESEPFLIYKLRGIYLCHYIKYIDVPFRLHIFEDSEKQDDSLDVAQSTCNFQYTHKTTIEWQGQYSLNVRTRSANQQLKDPVCVAYPTKYMNIYQKYRGSEQTYLYDNEFELDRLAEVDASEDISDKTYDETALKVANKWHGAKVKIPFVDVTTPVNVAVLTILIMCTALQYVTYLRLTEAVHDVFVADKEGVSGNTIATPFGRATRWRRAVANVCVPIVAGSLPIITLYLLWKMEQARIGEFGTDGAVTTGIFVVFGLAQIFLVGQFVRYVVQGAVAVGR